MMTVNYYHLIQVLEENVKKINYISFSNIIREEEATDTNMFFFWKEAEIVIVSELQTTNRCK